jgi:hypothetical protein
MPVIQNSICNIFGAVSSDAGIGVYIFLEFSLSFTRKLLMTKIFIASAKEETDLLSFWRCI